MQETYSLSLQMASTPPAAKTGHDIYGFVEPSGLVESVSVFESRSLLQRIASFLENAQGVLVAIELGQSDDLDMLGMEIGFGLCQDGIGRGQDFFMIVDGRPLQQRAQRLGGHDETS